MEIGIDDYIDDEEFIESEEITEDTTTQDTEDLVKDPEEDDFLQELLKTRGIEDMSKIKFQDDEGEINEVDWRSLSKEDKINILNSFDNGLDEHETQLINAVRQSKLTPNEYLQAVQNNAVQNYIQSQSQTPVYKVDEITDDELFISDLLTRTPDMTDDEAMDVLQRVKSNETLYTKQIEALRKEYKRLEDEQIQYETLQQQQVALDQFNQFAESIENSIVNFTEFSGCDINMDQEDMQELYDFITGFDSAGVSHLGKALNDPNTLVRMAWFALNGEQMINDINEYYKKEITNVRKESYNKGLQKAKDKSKVVYKPTQQQNNNDEIFDDLD